MSNLDSLKAQFNEYKSRGLTLNMERGQPADSNFDLSLPILSAVNETNYITDSGVDIRNYPGGVLGLIEARELFCEQLNVSADEIMLGNNSSLELMSRFLTWALLNGVKNSTSGWVNQSPRLIVTVPGYDRHFLLAQSLGFELVSVNMTPNGPDMDAVEALAKDDASIKGIYFVPTYSNPTGDTLSEDFARRLVNLDTAADDFTIFADDAYSVHHLEDNPQPAPDLLAIARETGQEDRVILFGSTSKVTFASGGIGLAGMSTANIAYWSKAMSAQTIGPNKAEQWRHVLFLRNYPGGIKGLMKAHAAILKPKFDVVQEVLNRELGNLDLATWTQPMGGYFVSLDTKKPVANRVVELAKEAGLALTPTGATFPDGIDPGNSNIRLAPTRPPLEEIEPAMEIVACCIKLASAEADVDGA
ncbi:aminopeptidase [Chromatiales bacterium (ex Bugula neritina AB1)]|nr:aminopeptidase [Chromatiales bacterium (ex Bugula neritina AB1)]